MDYFEGIIKTILEHEGYWVRQSFKVNLTKEEKRAVGKHSMPRPEIDLLAFNPASGEVRVIEAKSYLDSPGVRVKDLAEEHEVPEGRYKLFTCENYRNVVLSRLKQDLNELGMIAGEIHFTLSLVAGKVYQNKSDELQALFSSKGWQFWSPEHIRGKVYALAEKAYENEPAIITAKILAR